MKNIPVLGKVASAIIFAMGGLSTAAANEEGPRYLMSLKVEGQAKVQDWTVINHLYTSWTSKGAAYNCSAWEASPETIDWGLPFQQSRSCSQQQVRTATPVLFNPVLQTTKTGTPFEESRTISSAQFQPAIGARDFINGESIKAWSAWSNDGGHYGCDAWASLPEDVNLYVSFEQSRNCSQNQTRTRDVMDVWASGKETLKRTENDAQVISEVEKQMATGTKNFIASTRDGEWSAWSHIGEHYGCGTWSPNVNTVNLQDNFTQTRNCSQDQIATRTIYDVWRDGVETPNREETKTQTISETESQPAIGTKDYITTTRNGNWTAWSNSGSHYGCGAWSPTVDSKPLGEAFNQTRDCSQNQVRQRDIYNVWKSGAETLKQIEPGSQTISETETRSATGTKDYISGSRNGSWSAWTNDGAVFDCSVWSPDVSTVNLLQTFTQSRTCSQKQKNDRNIYDVWASGTETLNRNETGSQTISVTQSQSATGAKDYVTGVAYGSWSAWANSGSPFSCGTWSPAVTTVNLGDAFTQSRICTQTQTHVRDVFDVYRSGVQMKTGTESGSQNISVTQNQAATGTKDYITGTRDGAWGAWANTGSAYACGAWLPALNTVNLGSSFTQTRYCSQDQQRSRTIYNVWKSGVETVNTTESGSQVISVPQSQSAVGTKDYDTGTVAYGAWSVWSDSGNAYNCGAWGPLPNTVNMGDAFTQSRSCSQNQVRTRAVYQVWASGAQVQTGTDTGSQTISVTENQASTGAKDYITGTRNGAWSAWADNGVNYACGTWSPAVSTVNLGMNFTQSRSCSQDQLRSRTIYNVWKSGAETVNGTETGAQTLGVVQSQSAVGTKDYDTGTIAYGAWSAWANSGSTHTCGAWGPLPSTVNLGDAFTQSRSCSQNQTRSRAVYQVWASGAQVQTGTDTGSQTIGVTENQSATGTKDYITGTRNGVWSAWTNTGSNYACGTWSPGTGTYDLNVTFTQTRSCSQDQTHSRTIYNVWKSGAETVNTTESGLQTINVTQSQSAVGTRDYDTGTLAYGAWSAWSNSGVPYSCGAWGPLVGTVNLGDAFTQSRSCSQNQTRSRPVYTVMASGQQVAAGTDTASQTISVTQNQAATGTKDYITSTRTGAWSAWTNSGVPTACGTWSPAVSTVNLGTVFTQSRSCSQAQTQTRTIYNVWKSGAETVNNTETGNQTISVTQNQSATGTKDYDTGTVAYGAWSAWSNNGTAYSCGAWGPLASTVNLGDAFTQSRSCSQNQVRTRAIYQVWASGAQVQSGTDSASQTISVTQNQGATGTKDYITGTRTSAWSAWTNSGSPTACGTWSPAVSTVNLGTVFTQSRSCSQAQTNSRTIYNVWRSGAETISYTESGSQTISVTQNQSATGTKDYDTGTVAYGSYSAWSNSGATYSCGAWSPSPSTVNLGASFTQSRNCSQNQTRTRPVYQVWASGAQVQSGTDTASQTITVTESQSATGSKDYITGTTYGAWSGWSNSGAVYSCSGWSPSTGSVSWGQSFTQSRSCSQNQVRSRSLYNVWASGAQTVNTTESATQAVGVTQTQTATGSSDYVVSTTAGAWSGWGNTGGVYGCGGWGPATSTVNWGQAFTQTRSCSQDQSRSRPLTYNWASGATSSAGYEYGSQTISVGQSQGATGTKDYVSGTAYGGWSGWSNSGGLYSCSGWSPSCSTVNMGASFTQTQTCSQNQTQHRTVYDVWASGTQTVRGSESLNQTVPVGQSQAATGCKNYVTGSESVYGSWVAGGKSCGAWSPDVSTVNSGDLFIQSRSCSQTFTRTVTAYNVWSDGTKTVSSSNTESRSEPSTETQYAWGTKPGSYFWTLIDITCGGWGAPKTHPSGSCNLPGSTMSVTDAEPCWDGSRMIYNYTCQ
jgi:hypothetical protein